METPSRRSTWRAACLLSGAVLAGAVGCAVVPTAAQSGPVRFTVDSSQRARSISPYIYGSNAPDWGGRSRHLTFTRLGGNRWTAYNWENNASNAGSDYMHQNDAFLGGGDTPGEAVRTRVAAAQQAGAACLVTVPMAVYVAADKNGGGDVNQTPDYLNTRFERSLPRKGAPFAVPPDRADHRVYQDEFVHWLRGAFPQAGQGSTPALFYSLDNEPDLWSATHARIHPQKVTYAELLQRSVEYAGAIKAADPAGRIFGPASYGWNGYVTLQNAPDANGRDFLDFYLDGMRAAEARSGKRLLDVLDLHYYPEATGGGVRITEANTTPGVVEARLQATRSLWDPGYTEKSWITQYVTQGPLRLIPRMTEKIARHYPGTKLALTEYTFGAGGHISGGVAEADALGIFGRDGLWAAAWWEVPGGREFVDGALAMYRDYDGHGGSFGDTSVQAETNSIERATVYASVFQSTPDRMVLVAINKTDAPLRAEITINHSKPLGHADVYQLTAAASVPKQGESLSLNGKSLPYTLPAMSVSTLVLRP